MSLIILSEKYEDPFLSFVASSFSLFSSVVSFVSGSTGSFFVMAPFGSLYGVMVFIVSDIISFFIRFSYSVRCFWHSQFLPPYTIMLLCCISGSTVVFCPHL